MRYRYQRHHHHRTYIHSRTRTHAHARASTRATPPPPSTTRARAMTRAQGEVKAPRHMLKETGIEMKRTDDANDFGVDYAAGLRRGNRTAPPGTSTARAR